jgi:hypothetical protein
LASWIVGDVQFAPESRGPAFGVSERREQGGEPLRYRQVRRRFQIRDRQIISRQPFDRASRQRYRKPRTRILIESIEGGRIAFAEPAGNLVRLAANCGRRQQKLHASMNRKDGVVVVETDEGVNRGPREQQPPKRRAAVIRREPPWQHQADPSARPRKGHRAFHKQLVSIGVTELPRRVQA